MSESRFSLESELPCVHCGMPLPCDSQFCFDCGAPVVPELCLPNAPPNAAEELDAASFSPLTMRGRRGDVPELEPGEPIEITSLKLEVVVEEIPICFDDDDDEQVVADPHGTMIAAAPDRPMPFWPAPPKGDTVVAPPPRRPHRAS